MNTTTTYYMALQHIGIGYQTLQRLIGHLTTVEAVWNASYNDLIAAQASPEFAKKFVAATRSFDISLYVTSISHNDVTAISLENDGYPYLLKKLHSPPLVIYVRGSLDALSLPSLAVVGTRTPTPYGIAATHRIVEPLARNNVCIVSGLAYGIDAEAHAAALRGGGTTVAVLGNGIDEVYPRSNVGLAENILEHGGTILSEYPPHTEVQKHFFPQRNRIIAGLCPATLIIEAGVKSGALITARIALDEDRQVFAVPGPIDVETATGPNNLIKMGAAPATCAEDFSELFALDSAPRIADNGRIVADTAEERALLPLLSTSRHIDELVAVSTLDTSVVNATLSLLEMKGRVRHLGGMYYVRIN